MTRKTITHELTLETHECSNCSGVFALTESYWKLCREQGKAWICPYCGQSRIFVENNVKKLNRELSQERASHDQTKAELRELKLSSEKTKERISKGICPCCHRYFKNLHRHMQTKHPKEQ